MKKNVLILTLMFAMALATFSCVTESREGESTINHIVVNDNVPEFSLDSPDGTTLASPEGFNQKTTLLVFFTTGCGYCRTELPKIDRVFELTASMEDLQVITIARDQSAAEIAEYWTDNALTVPVYLDAGRVVFDRFANMTIPRSYLIDAAGTVKWYHVGELTESAEQLVEMMQAHL